jgi:hypothetical protein
MEAKTGTLAWAKRGMVKTLGQTSVCNTVAPRAANTAAARGASGILAPVRNRDLGAVLGVNVRFDRVRFDRRTATDR